MNFRPLLTLLLMVLVLATGSIAQVIGDYRSAVNNGLWVTPATWEKWDGTGWVTATTAPSAAYNVTIRSGYNVIVETSGKNCLNLTIEAGAQLYADSSLP
ncbi:hypothetical protein EHM92_08185, partial [bacterium]